VQVHAPVLSSPDRPLGPDIPFLEEARMEDGGIRGLRVTGRRLPAHSTPYGPQLRLMSCIPHASGVTWGSLGLKTKNFGVIDE
jgi:hypothetical protein